MTNWLKLGIFFKITNRMNTTNVRYINLSPKGNMVKLSNIKAGGLLGHRCGSVGGAVEKWGWFGTVIQFEERVVNSVCCFRGDRDRL
jgi:hypothetical protein